MTFPYQITLDAASFKGSHFDGNNVNIEIYSGLTTLLGPNGSGKTIVLKALRDKLKANFGEDQVRYISAGRMGIIEGYRSNNIGNGEQNADDTHLGHYSYVSSRKKSETVVGDFVALDQRNDLWLKVEARLRGLFGKTLKLSWTQNGLKVQFKSTGTGNSYYGAGSEASGLTQLVAILAALYDDEIKYLLIDEPEVSLHPQLQGFILKEICTVSGDPAVLGKKVIIISTHSPSMLRLKTTNDLPAIIFFKSSKEVPIQISPTEPLLSTNSFRSLIIRLAERYKIAFFSQNVLLSEGVSDEYVITALADITNANFESTGVEVLPVSGKADIKNARTLFNLVGKNVIILADLDVLDDDVLINYIDNDFLDTVAVGTAGYIDLNTLYNEVKIDLSNAINNNWTDIEAKAQTQAYYNGKGSLALRKNRSALSFLSGAPTPDITVLNNQSIWQPVHTKLVLLLNLLDAHNVVLIRIGSIEDCYVNTLPRTGTKPIDSAIEADFLTNNSSNPSIYTNYSDVLKAIDRVKIPQLVDQAALLRGELGKVLGLITANLTDQTTQHDIDNAVDVAGNDLASIFEITKSGLAPNISLQITIKSSLFSDHPPSFTFGQNETIDSLQQKLPSI